MRPLPQPPPELGFALRISTRDLRWWEWWAWPADEADLVLSVQAAFERAMREEREYLAQIERHAGESARG